MRILIGLHHVTLGGDTINAVEIASRLQDHGHRVWLMAFTASDMDGNNAPLLRMAEDRHVPVRTLTEPQSIRGRARAVAALTRFVRAEKFDVVHTFGHRDTYLSFFGPYGIVGVPLLVNDYGSTLTPALPLGTPLVVGTRQLRDEAVRGRRGPVFAIEPPVDVQANTPNVVDGHSFRTEHGIAPSDVLLVVVSRLAFSMKFEGIRGVIEAVRLLDNPAVRLIVVGDGDASLDLSVLAEQVNAAEGRQAVVLTGWRVDPRPAYAAADIVLGMGHSALRGMAFGKPVVVLGECGYAEALTRETLGRFLYGGLYGRGDGKDMGEIVAAQLQRLLDESDDWPQLGQLGRDAVYATCSLERAAERLEEIYDEIRSRRRSWRNWSRDALYLARCYVPAKVRSGGR